jgi:hypothetical protein
MQPNPRANNNQNLLEKKRRRREREGEEDGKKLWCGLIQSN